MLRETVFFRFVCREFSSRNGYYDWIYASPAKLVSFLYSQQLMILMVNVRERKTPKHPTTNETFSLPLAKWTHKILFCIRYGVSVRAARKCTIDLNVVSAHLRVWRKNPTQIYTNKCNFKVNEMNIDNETVCLHSNSKQFLSRNHNNNKRKTAISCSSLRFYYCLLTAIMHNKHLSFISTAHTLAFVYSLARDSFTIGNKRDQPKCDRVLKHAELLKHQIAIEASVVLPLALLTTLSSSSRCNLITIS